MYGLLATTVVVVHFGFILFVVFGALLSARWPRAMWIHLPAAAWGAYVELSGKVCPLTPLENRFRTLAGGEGYAGSFIDRYLVALVYPAELTRDAQVALGIGALLVNVVLYAWVIRRWRRRSAGVPAGSWDDQTPVG